MNSGWRDVYLGQLHDLVLHAGVDGVYVDEYPMPPQGCFCDSCRAKYKDWSGGEAMPADPTSDPAAYKKVLDFNTYTVSNLYGEIARTVADASSKGVAAGNRSEAAIPFLSNHQLPCADSGGEYFEWQGMEAHTGVLSAPKIEYDTGRGRGCLRDFVGSLSNSSFETDVLISWGWATSRDAAYGNIPHTWDPASPEGPDFVQCGAGAMVSYGLTANPDHTEAGIPNATLFRETYEIGARVSVAINGTLPVLWAVVAMDEWTRDQLVPLVVSPPSEGAMNPWTGLMGETLGAWQTLTRWGAPRGVAHLWQLGARRSENNTGSGVDPDPEAALRNTKVLVIPSAARPTEAQAAAIQAFAARGGQVVNMTGLSPSGWLHPGERNAQVAKLRADIATVAGAPPAWLNYIPSKPLSGSLGARTHSQTDEEVVRPPGLGSLGGAPEVPPQSIDAHLNVLAVPGNGNRRAILAVTNAFGWCGHRETAPLRPPNMTNAKVEVMLQAGASVGDVRAYDHVSQQTVPVQPSKASPDAAEVVLPDI